MLRGRLTLGGTKDVGAEFVLADLAAGGLVDGDGDFCRHLRRLVQQVADTLLRNANGVRQFFLGTAIVDSALYEVTVVHGRTDYHCSG